MLLVLLATFLISLTSICLGHAVLSRLTQLEPTDLAESVFHSYWIGFSILMMAATVAACIGPVGSYGVFALLAVLIATLTLASTRGMVAASLSALQERRVLGALLTVATLSLLAVFWQNCGEGYVDCQPDSGFYHVQIIRWYSDYGATPGMALLHHRLGFHSGLFAVAALLDRGLLTGRSGIVVILSAVAICLWFGAVQLLRAWRTPEPGTLFWPAYLLLALCGLETTLVSDYPDTLLILYIGAAFWMIWRWRERGLARQACWTMLLLGAAAMNIKLSGVLFLGFVFLVTTLCTGPTWRRSFAYGGFSLLFIAPVLVIQGITSGHPLFPALALALPVDWAAPNSLVSAARATVRNFPLYGYDPPQPLTTWEMVRQILVGRLASHILSVLGVVAVSAGIAWRKRNRTFEVAMAAGLGAIGLIQLIQVPSIRFSLGYLTVLPAFICAQRGRNWFLAVYAGALAYLLTSWFHGNRLDILRQILYLGVVLGFGWAALRNLRIPARTLIACLIVGQLMRPLVTIAGNFPAALYDSTWVWVPRLPVLSPGQVIDATIGDVAYKEPADRFHCWAEAPPCAPYPYQANLSTISALTYRCGAGKLACGFRLKRGQ